MDKFFPANCHGNLIESKRELDDELMNLLRSGTFSGPYFDSLMETAKKYALRQLVEDMSTSTGSALLHLATIRDNAADILSRLDGSDTYGREQFANIVTVINTSITAITEATR